MIAFKQEISFGLAVLSFAGVVALGFASVGADNGAGDPDRTIDLAEIQAHQEQSEAVSIANQFLRHFGDSLDQVAANDADPESILDSRAVNESPTKELPQASRFVAGKLLDHAVASLGTVF